MDVYVEENAEYCFIHSRYKYVVFVFILTVVKIYSKQNFVLITKCRYMEMRTNVIYENAHNILLTN